MISISEIILFLLPSFLFKALFINYFLSLFKKFDLYPKVRLFLSLIAIDLSFFKFFVEFCFFGVDFQSFLYIRAFLFSILELLGNLF